MRDASDSELVQRCLDGNRNAFAVLIERYEKPVYNVALRMLKNGQDAEDVAQTVFLKAFEKLSSFNPDYKFFSWLYRMTVNESINWSKKRRPSEELPVHMVDAGGGPAEELARRELSDQVGEALLMLSPEDRAIIVLKHFQGFPYRDIAYILDTTEKTVKSRLYTARQRLKDALLIQGLFGHDS